MILKHKENLTTFSTVMNAQLVYQQVTPKYERALQLINLFENLQKTAEKEIICRQQKTKPKYV